MTIKQISVLTTLCLVSSSFGTINVTGANVQGFQDESGGSLGAGVLALLVVDTGGDGFGPVIEGDFQIGSTLDTDDFIDDGNDLIISILDSTSVFSSSVIQAGTGDPIDFAHAGQQFAVYWFPALSDGGGDVASVAGDNYGIAREADWVLPTTDGTNVSGETVNSAGAATFTVQPVVVPEPTSLVLLGLGSFSLIARRRRA